MADTAEALNKAQNEVLELIRQNASLNETLERLIHLIEAQLEGAYCSVLLVDEDGAHLRHGTAPSLPPDYIKLVEGLAIGPMAGSCGTAAYRHEAVFVINTQTDPLWAPYREVAARFELAACWSIPIFSSENRVLGIFAMYYHQSRPPTLRERPLIELATRIASIAIEHKQNQEALQKARQQIVEHRRAREFAALYAASQDLSTKLDVGLLLEKIALRALDILRAESAMVLLFDRVRNDLELVFVAGTAMPVSLGTRLALGEGVAGRVAQSRQPMIVNDYQAWGHGSTRFDLQETKSVLGVPMLVGGDLIGVLGVSEIRTTHKFTDADARLLTLFGAQAAAAVRNARLLEETRAAEEKYRNIFEHAVEGIFQSTPEGKVLTASPALAHMLGYETPAAYIASVTDLGSQLYVDPRRRDEIHRLLETEGAVIGFECQVYRRDRSIIWVAVNAHAARDVAGTTLYYEGTAVDITRRKQLEDQLRQSQKMEAIGQLAGGVAHDFNNLLTVILAHSDLQLTGGGLDAGTKEAIQQIRDAATRAAALTSQLLAFSRKQVRAPRLVDLNRVIGDIAKMLRRLIGENVALDLRLAPDTPPVMADPTMIEQVLVNLAVNARDAMPKGGTIVVATEVLTVSEADAQVHPGAHKGEFVRMSMHDTGIGMSSEVQAHIFEPFFTTKEVGKGSGLGLATVFGIMQQHQGWIEVDSKVGGGTNFKLYWPAQRQTPIPFAPSAAPGPTLLRGTETVLFVEDDRNVRMVAAMGLRRLGYQVLEAGSGNEALEIWLQQKDTIELLITDQIMPGGLTGTELAERLHAEKPDLAVICISGYVGRSQMVIEPGETIRFMPKPYGIRSLAEFVREALNAARLPDTGKTAGRDI